MRSLQIALLTLCVASLVAGALEAEAGSGPAPLAEVRFGTSPVPARRRSAAQAKVTILMVQRPENGEEVVRPLLKFRQTDIRREELISSTPLVLRVHYEKYLEVKSVGAEAPKTETDGVDGKTYLVTFPRASGVPNVTPPASTRESKRLREDYAREFLVLAAVRQVQGTPALYQKRAPAVEGILMSLMRPNPAKAEPDMRPISVEARLVARESLEGQDAVRFAIVMKFAVRLSPEAELFVESRGFLVLRLADAALLSLETDDDISSTKLHKGTDERYISGHGIGHSRFTYGPVVPPVPAIEPPAAP